MNKKGNKGFCVKKIFCAIAIGLTNGFFGGGGGMLCVPLLENVYKLDNKKSHATAISIILPLSVISSIIYLNAVSFVWTDFLFVSIGVILGGILGAFALKKLNSKIVRIIFAIVMLAAGIKMVI